MNFSIDDKSDFKLVFSREKYCDMVLKAKNYMNGTYLRLVITGNADSQLVKALKNEKVLQQICDEVGLEYLEIEDSTLPVYDGKYLEKDITVRGEIYRMLLPSLTSADVSVRKKALLALKIALSAIDGNSVFDVVN